MKLTGFAFGAALLLSLCTLQLGTFGDDWLQIARVRGDVPDSMFGSSWDLFNFAPGGARQERLIQRGVYPWWFEPHARGAFFRPLSSALIHFDVGAVGDHVTLWHLHSIGWYLALVAAAFALYRRALPVAAAPLALLVFAVDDAHWMPVAWLANRNALVAAVPALLGLTLHLRWREDGWRPGVPLSMLAYATGLAGGEGALGVLGYVFLYEVLGVRPGPLGGRLRALVPLFCVGGLYALLHVALGYGVTGSPIYLDPIHRPLEFLAVLPERLLVLCGSLTLGASSDAWMFLDRGRLALAALGLVGLSLWALWLSRAKLSWTDAQWRRVRWLALSAVLSAVPVSATFPADRLLVASSIGGAGVAASLLCAFWEQRSALARAAKGVLIATQCLLPLPSWVAGPLLFAALERQIKHGMVNADVGRLDGRVVFPAAPDPFVGLFGTASRAAARLPLARSWNVLSIAPYDHRLSRTGDRSFELALVSGHMLGTLFEQLFREGPLHEGDRVALDALDVTVLDAPGGRPTRIEVDARVPLEELTFLRWRNAQLEVFVPPAVGQSVQLTREPGPFELLMGLMSN